ncbi:hypothetical protein [Xanthomonas oryzae]|uniref:hypothetical protein n=1 Tax=Xanthomonas oryzae TaxID=347 RepID=UPI0012AF4EAA|nr:hypothetical protein [Xanthomonas oryzae]
MKIPSVAILRIEESEGGNICATCDIPMFIALFAWCRIAYGGVSPYFCRSWSLIRAGDDRGGALRLFSVAGGDFGATHAGHEARQDLTCCVIG